MDQYAQATLREAVKSIEAVLGDEPSSADETHHDPELGVLFVHGIGSQPRGDTLPWAGDPLFKWLSLWHNRGKVEKETLEGPYLDDTRLVLPLLSEGDAPPFTHLRFPATSGKDGQAEKEWILAESWWANDFLPPTYSQAIHLVLNVAPWLIEQTGFRIIKDLLDAVADKEGLAKRQPAWEPLAKVVDFLGNVLYRLARITTLVIGAFIMLLLGVVAQVLVLALVVLAFFPPLRSLAVNLQLALSGWLGDAYLMAVSPMRYSAMTSRVQRDVKWLFSVAHCKSVAVIAHSGGAAVAHEALTRKGAPGSPDAKILLVTYGSGQSKVNSMRKMDGDRNWFYNWSPIFRIAGVALIVAAFALLIGGSDRGLGWWLLASGIVLNVAFWVLGGRVLEKLNTYTPLEPVGNEWIDYRAVADIVPDERIKDSQGKSVTERSNNLHSLLQDHGAYWQNGEEFAADIVRLLHAKAYAKHLAADEMEQLVLERARVRREDRVRRYLAAGLLLIVSIPMIWMDLGSRIEQWLGAPIRAFVLNTFTGADVTGQTIIKSVPEATWNYTLGMVAVVILVALFGRFILAPLWSGWNRAERDAMFERKVSDERGKCKKTAALFIVVSAVIPVVAFVVAAFQFYQGGKTGFIESITGIRDTIEVAVRSLPLPDAVAGWVHSEFGGWLSWGVLILAGSVAVTSLVNVWTTISDLSSKKLSGETPARKEVFDQLLTQLNVTPVAAKLVASSQALPQTAPSRLARMLGRIARGWVIGVLLVAFFAISFSFRLIGAGLDEHSSGPATLDGRFSYTPAQAYDTITNYSDAARQLYLWNAWTLDLVYPAVYGLLASLLILYAAKKAGAVLAWSGVALVPFFGSAADYLENICITAMIATGARRDLGLGEIASVLTPIKWTLGGISLLLVVAAFLWLGYAKLRKSLGRQPATDQP